MQFEPSASAAQRLQRSRALQLAGKGPVVFLFGAWMNSLQEQTDVLLAKVDGIPELKKRLNGVASGTSILWNSRATLTQFKYQLKNPPPAMVREVQKACDERKIDLALARK